MYTFDSKRIQCLGMIKYLMVRMVQIIGKFVMVDVVIAFVPLTYGIFLSKHLVTSMGGSIQYDMSYDTIFIFQGDAFYLYRDPK